MTFDYVGCSRFKLLVSGLFLNALRTLDKFGIGLHRSSKMVHVSRWTFLKVKALEVIEELKL